MEFRFDIGIFYNAELKVTDRVTIKVSKETAFFLVDGEHISSLYPEYLSEDKLVEIVKDIFCEDLECPDKELTEDHFKAIAKWLKEKIGGV